MARYTGPVCRLCRREGVKLFLKGDRCRLHKCAMEKRNTTPGQHGQARRQKASEYGVQMREKQKVKRMYGMLEQQFRKYFGMAEKQQGVTGQNLLLLLERRLDNVVYKMGLAPSRKFARQLIVHDHLCVNGRRVNRPSYLIQEADEITVNNASKEIPLLKALSEKKDHVVPAHTWLTFSADTLTGKIVRLPKRDDITADINEQLIVELYSK